MKLTAQAEIASPADRAFAALSDMDALAAELARRGITLEPLPEAGENRWQIAGEVQGQRREFLCDLETDTSARTLRLSGEGSGLEIAAIFAVTPIADDRSCLEGDLDASARSLKSRLLLQTLRLNHAGMERRFAQAVEALARHVGGQPPA